MPRRLTLAQLATVLATLALIPALGEEPLFQAKPLTAPGSFTPGIEGPAVDASGHIFAVNLSRQQTIGRVDQLGTAEIFVTLPGKSTGNGIRIGTDGTLYVADYVEHNVLRIHPQTREIKIHAHNPHFNQPNDLTLATDGTLFASDPNWKEGTGQIWRIDPDGSTHRLAEGMGTTNGIELSPDGTRLYVNESVQRNLWFFTVTATKTLSHKQLLRRFADFGFDGMRCDVDGNLYVTRHGKGTIVKLSPSGEILTEIKIPGENPTNLCFGGEDGRTVYVTEAKQGRLIQFRVDRPGLEFARLQRKSDR
jgi:gluconolactonase